MLQTDTYGQLSPGELHRSHEFLDGVDNCSKCHSPDRESMSTLCLTCHTAISDRQADGKGLHGRAEYQDCRLCHVEHQGRNYDLVYFKGGIKAFDHRLTGYELQGSHAKLDCRECHRVEHFADADQLLNQAVALDRTYLGLSTNCLSCHLDQHRDQLGLDCGKCHGFDKWKPAPGFTHAKSAYDLTGKHIEVVCEKCHPLLIDDMSAGSQKYANYRPIEHANCSNCHKDVHEGRLGNECTKCHSTNGWRQVRAASFDHDKTRYPLKGKHAPLDCQKCHSNDSGSRKLAFARCLDCHSDFHERAFVDRQQKGACEECHTVDGFTPALFRLVQHDSTDYPLSGAHRAIPCSGCHRTQNAGSFHYTFDFAATRCNDCHRDPHGGKVDKFIRADGCETCHTVRTWDESIFDHGKTEFELVGKHGTVSCKSCHNDNLIEPSLKVAFDSLETTCESCHKDIHGGQFVVEGTDSASNCDRCHTSTDWKPARFDHTRDSRFVLDGAHNRVACVSCHAKKSNGAKGPEFIVYKPLDTACVSCHAGGTPVGKAES